MIVKCIENTGENLPKELLTYHGWNKEMVFLKVTIGKEYVVYAIMYVENHPFYMICGDDYDGLYVNYPELVPGVLFEIVDNSKSFYWMLNSIENKEERISRKNIGFKEIIEDKFFYGNLLEGDEENVKIFSCIKRKIDNENER